MIVDPYWNHWERVNDAPAYAWHVLHAHLVGQMSNFDDWLYHTLGELQLVALARQHVPQHTPPYAFQFGRVSRVYGLPVRDSVGDFGYGNPNSALVALIHRYNPDEAAFVAWTPCAPAPLPKG